MTPTDRAALRKLAALAAQARGWNGEWRFEPEHTEDRGGPVVADCVDIEDRVVYYDTDGGGEPSHISISGLDDHVLEALAVLLNAGIAWKYGGTTILSLLTRLDTAERLLGEAARFVNRARHFEADAIRPNAAACLDEIRAFLTSPTCSHVWSQVGTVAAPVRLCLRCRAEEASPDGEQR